MGVISRRGTVCAASYEARPFGVRSVARVDFLWIDAFVGANLVQSAFTGFCPLAMLVRRAGLTDRPGTMWTC